MPGQANTQLMRMTGSGSTPPPAREETRCRNRQDHFTPAIDGLAPLHPLHWPVERTPSRLPGAPSHPAASLQWSSASGGRRRSSTECAQPPFPGYGWVTSAACRSPAPARPCGTPPPISFEPQDGARRHADRALPCARRWQVGRRPPRPRNRSATPCLALSARAPCVRRCAGSPRLSREGLIVAYGKVFAQLVRGMSASMAASVLSRSRRQMSSDSAFA